MSADHRLSRMAGRSLHEQHRAATPLELFFDLTFVIAFSVSASELAHAVAEGHLLSGLVGFVFTMFAVIWAWINFSWFASAYDTDDWLFRVTTMVQMVGVLVTAMGIPDVYRSIDDGGVLDNRVLVGGYVVMRAAMVFQWLRVARQDPERRVTALTYAKLVALAQLGWVALIFLETSLLVTFVLMLPLYVLELMGPRLAERRGGTPWHAHHIAERYGLLAIIALGETLIGTIAALSAVVQHQGWSVDVAVVGLAGTGLGFGLWWIYFVMPSGEVLHDDRSKGFLWGYGHIPLFMAIAGAGAGLHVAAYYLEDHSKVGSVAVVASVAIPVAVFTLVLFALDRVLTGGRCVRVAGVVLSLVVLTGAVALAALHVPLSWSLLVLALAPVPAIVAHERLVRAAGSREGVSAP